MKYRPELDGLRAIAVLSVVLFHAGLEKFEGGFVGVDVFFVLSGFLITSLLIKETDERRFSFGHFYERRIRRLLPPILPVLFFVGFFSAAFLSTDQFNDVVTSIYATLGVSSNWYFLSTVDYFGGPGHETPLLHTWSLSIEEQFYLLFPLVIVALKNQIKLLRLACILLLMVSFAYSSRLVYSGDEESAFYNSFGRYWEILLGASLACLKLRTPRKPILIDFLEIVGVSMIVWSVMTYEPGMMFPGPAALLPTIGTALLIYANGQGRLISPVLRLKPLVFTGLISYGLYLWHWPLLVFTNLLKPGAGLLLIMCAVSLAFVMSFISYRYLEAPIRQRVCLISRKGVYGFAAVSYISVCFVAFIVSAHQFEVLRNSLSDAAYRLVYGPKSESIKSIEIEKARYLEALNLNFTGKSGDFLLDAHLGHTCSFDKRNTVEAIVSCVIGQAKLSNNFLIIGDSIGRDTLNAVRRAYPDFNFIMLHNSSCPASEFTEGKRVCFNGLSEVLGVVFEKISIDGVLVNFSYHPEFWREFKHGLPLIKQYTENVAVLGVTPFFKRPVSDYLKAAWGSSIPNGISKDDESMLRWRYDEIVNEARQTVLEQNVEFVDLTEFYCPHETCSIWIGGDTLKPLFIDNQHLTDLGINALGEFLSKQRGITHLLTASPEMAKGG